MNDRITLQAGALPTKEELMTAHFLAQWYPQSPIRFLAVSPKRNTKTPDIKMFGKYWEIKCPIGKGANTIKRPFQVASKQAENLIFDLRRSKMPDRVNITRLEKEFNDIRSVKRLIIITKHQNLLELSK